MAYDLVKNAHKQRLIKGLSESEDFAKSASLIGFPLPSMPSWSDVKRSVSGAVDTVGDVGKFLWHDAKENPWTTAGNIAATAFTGGLAGAPIWAYRANKARKGYSKYKKYKRLADGKPRFYEKSKNVYNLNNKTKNTQKMNQAKANHEKYMNTKTFNRKSFSDPVKFPGKKAPVNNVAAKTVAAPFRAAQGVANVATHPTYGGRLLINAPKAGAGWLKNSRLARWGIPALTGLGVGTTLYGLGKAPFNPKGFARDGNMFVDGYYRQREAKANQTKMPKQNLTEPAPTQTLMKQPPQPPKLNVIKGPIKTQAPMKPPSPPKVTNPLKGKGFGAPPPIKY